MFDSEVLNIYKPTIKVYKKMKSHFFGIHVGNSTASIAIYKEDGKIQLLTNEIGERITPAIVSIKDNEKLVGSVAKSLLVSDWKYTITNNKRLMNRSLEESEKEDIRQRSRISMEYMNNELCYCIPFKDKSKMFTPSQISTQIYRKLYRIAKSAVYAENSDVISCVMLVPTHYNAASIEYTKIAVEDAGWTILQVIKEPTAPILAYSLLEKTQMPDICETFVLVYRLGGVSCGATVMRIYNGMVNILGSSCKEDVGADHILTQLTKYLAQEFFNKYKLDPKESKKSMNKLKYAAESCMHVLSNLNNANCFVESLYEGVDFKLSVSRARLEMYLTPLLSVYTKPIHDVLEKTGLENEDIQKVILCGGLLKIPKLQSIINEMFSKSEVLCGIAPDEVLAYGAAMQAGYLVACRKLKSSQRNYKIFESNVTNVLPLTYPVEFTNGNIEVRIVENNKEIHCGRYLVIPSHEKIYLSKFLILDGDFQTFLIKVIIEGKEKLTGEMTVIPDKDLNYDVDINLFVHKKLQIKLTTINSVMNERHTKSIILKSV